LFTLPGPTLAYKERKGARRSDGTAITSHDAVSRDELATHNWRVSQLKRLGCPGHRPRSTPVASTGIRSSGWCSAAARRGSPRASLADVSRDDTPRCWQPESMWPWRRHDSACASRPRAQPIRTRSHTSWPALAITEPVPADRPGLLRAGRPVPSWAVGTALLAPVALVGGWLIAGALQPASFSPMRQTMSVLAGHSGTDRWVMTAALLLVGSCQITTGASLTGVRLPARILLILTGLSTLGVAATPEPATGPTSRHLAFAVSCVVMTAVWPVFVARRAPAPIVDP